LQLDIAQHRVAFARDLVLEQRAAPGAEELPEHRPLVDVALPVALIPMTESIELLDALD
jgi:hypothetical protein